ncbi:MAG: hypothetical protein ACOC0U_07350 [Desulfovibrionales bacterium]
MDFFLPSSHLTDIFLLTWALFHGNLLLARGNAFLGMAYFLLIFPIQAFSLNSTTGQVYLSCLIAGSVFNIWLVLSLWKDLKDDPWRGYKKLFRELKREKTRAKRTRGR